jgi:photosystem II stability/assembly factor-like uncharacterized protein
MVTTRQLKVKEGDVLVLVGTAKGLWVLRSDGKRAKWDEGGPHLAGQSVYAAAFDGRSGRRRLWTSSDSWFGATLNHSDDFGKTWVKPEKSPVRFPEESKTTLKRIWQIRPEGPGDAIFVGTEPTALFRSDDGGQTFELNQALFNHPHRPKWEPGGGGQCLHTILPDPADAKRIWIAMSTGGFYRSDDGGGTWNPRNRNIKVTFMPEAFPEFGQCVHKVVSHPAAPGRLYLQHHWGVYRSDDAGENWKAIEKGLPSTFGFAMSIHPHDPDMVYVLPLESDGFRCTPEGKLRVYRTADGGKAWKAMTKGLPQKNANETVLRDGMDMDGCATPGVYFGTKSGKVYASRDAGTSWKLIASGLPQVQCVKVAMVPGKRKGKE